MKYMNVVINVNPNLARIFLYHAIGTSLSLWVFTIIHETADAIAEIDAGMHYPTWNIYQFQLLKVLYFAFSFRQQLNTTVTEQTKHLILYTMIVAHQMH